MTDTPPIPPALTPEEWAENGDPVVDGYIDWETCIVDVNSHYSGDGSKRFIPGLIALAFNALPDGHPAKLTREWIETLRNATVIFRVGDMEVAEDESATAKLRAIADALASYLPPE